MKRNMLRVFTSLLIILSLILSLPSCDIIDDILDNIIASVPESGEAPEAPSVDLDNIPAFTKYPYVIINNNVPFFTKDEIVSESYEYYGELDSLGRCTVTMACVGIDIMPTDERGSIGQVKPTGWHTVKYDCVDGKYLYNRCHLIGYQLTGENANTRNLITGTRYLNIKGMLDFENMIADYVKETENHVMLRVTPIFKGANLVASGVLMEAWSVEDNGEGVCFNIYAYNNQPGVIIDYKTGVSRLDDGTPPPEEDDEEVDEIPEPTEVYYVNIKTHKYHKEGCRYATGENVERRECSEIEVLEDGNEPCGVCKP